MFKRYLYSFAGFLGLLVIYWLTLLPVLAVRTSLETSQYAMAMLIWVVLVVVSFPFILAMLLKKIWFFRGQGEPVVLDLLQEMLFAVNEPDIPVGVRRQGKKMVVSWRCREPHWGERMEKAGMTRLYELWLRFDNHTKTVTMTDRARSLNWDLSPITVKTGRFSLPSPFYRVEIGPEWGVENYNDTIPQDFSYTPNEIKAPILNTILKNGWNVRFSLL